MANDRTWHAITGHPGYQVSNDGQVRNSRTGRVLKTRLFPNGYVAVNLGKGPTYLVHRLVASTFVGNQEGKPQVNHKNGVRSDYRAENLEWVTCSENHRHSYRELMRKPHALTRAAELFKDGVKQTFSSGSAAAKYLGVRAGSIASAAINNHKCKGYEVRYV